jgi:D,D-heptose 1,7-bisphosphate phosphatase
VTGAGSGARVAILAGGRGTRLRERSGTLPKPMVPVAGRPVLEHQIDLCRRHGFDDIALLVHYEHAAIQDHFGDGAAFGVRLHYIVEADARGTAGAVADALPHMAARFLLLYGDVFFDVDLSALWRVHAARGARATLVLHPNDHPADSDLVELDGDGGVLRVLGYPHPPGQEVRNLVNAALYVFERDGLAQFVPGDRRTDIAKDMLPAMLRAGVPLHGHVTPEYLKDMGTPERLDKVARDIEFGLPEMLSGRAGRAAVFLDRDGTLNREVQHLRSRDQFELLDGVGGAIRRLNRAGRLSVVVTNQPVIARGEATRAEVDAVHARMDGLLGEQGAYIDAVYLCPHHPDGGFAGEVRALKIACACRKPGTGMIDAACADLRIARAASWMVGDLSSDMEAGRLAGLRTILVSTGHAGTDDKHVLQPDYTVPDLAAAVGWILDGHAAAIASWMPLLDAARGAQRLVLVGGTARSGKSSGAQVLKELVELRGRRAHVISLDSFLHPSEHRLEGEGVLARYDMARACDELLGVAAATTRTRLAVDVYHRGTRRMLGRRRELSIGAQDMLIVEGVPALLDPVLGQAPAWRVFVDVDPALRRERFVVDYRSRGRSGDQIDALWTSREQDETPVVAASRHVADDVVTLPITS